MAVMTVSSLPLGSSVVAVLKERAPGVGHTLDRSVSKGLFNEVKIAITWPINSIVHDFVCN